MSDFSLKDLHRAYELLDTGILVTCANFKLHYVNRWMKDRMLPEYRDASTLMELCNGYDMSYLKTVIAEVLQHRSARVISQTFHTWTIPLPDPHFEDGLMRQKTLLLPITLNKTKENQEPCILIQIKNASFLAIQSEKLKLMKKLEKEVEHRKLVEEELFQINESLEAETQKLISVNEDLQDFAHVVSHDLKAPLRGITSVVNWLMEDYAEALDETGQEYLKKLVTRTQRMDRLITGILQYSRTGKVTNALQNLESKQVIHEVLESLNLPDHISICVEEGLPNVCYEPILLTQVFQNLLSNAIKHLQKDTGKITVSCHEEETFWKFCVQDNGVGIPEQHFERIFKLFQSLKAQGASDASGVGLALVKKIVERNQGKVWVESVEGEGSSFFFTVKKGGN